MKPTIVSTSITFKEGSMEIQAIFTDGRILEKTIPIDGRILRLDYDFFHPNPRLAEDGDGA